MPTLSQSIFLYVLIMLISIMIMVFLYWFLNKQEKDSKKVRGWLIYQLDKMMYFLNKKIYWLKDTEEKFEDLIYVIYAKKKWFIENINKWINNWYELYIATKDSLSYLEQYTKSSIYPSQDAQDTTKFFDFLYKLNAIKNILKSINIALVLVVVWCIYVIVRSSL